MKPSRAVPWHCPGHRCTGILGYVVRRTHNGGHVKVLECPGVRPIGLAEVQCPKCKKWWEWVPGGEITNIQNLNGG